MPPRIGLIMGSTRNPRINPQIADFVLQTIHNSSSSSDSTNTPSIQKIDLVDWNLPFFDEPVIPQMIKTPEGYTHEHTRKWSREIRALDGFIFVSPQYNWGIPAPLKNALDYLFNEWTTKPAAIITYGGHGGGQCADALSTVLKGLRMRQTEKRVMLKYPSLEWARENAFVGGDLGLDARDEGGLWAGEREEIVGVWEELVGLIEEKPARREGG